MIPLAGPAYIAAVLTLYVDLPDTPLRASVQDQWLARNLYKQGVPLSLVEAALTLASLRRLFRSPDLPPLPPIRSFAYFQPVITELQHNPLPDAISITFDSSSAMLPKNRRPVFKKIRFLMSGNMRYGSELCLSSYSCRVRHNDG